jgi:2-iminobutanoate/2-iminopropanoate deaminase
VTQRSAVRTDRAPAPVEGAPYSQAIVAGNLVFVSGQTPLDPSGKLVEGGIAEQTRQVFANLSAILDEAGSGLDRVVKTTVFLTNLGDFGEMNATYAGYFSAAPPARATVEVSKLPAGASVEIECVALLS